MTYKKIENILKYFIIPTNNKTSSQYKTETSNDFDDALIRTDC